MLKGKGIIEDLNVHQGKLETALGGIFPHFIATKNARKEVAIKNPLTGDYYEVDVWYPDLNLCFEYQDEYHYHSTWYSNIPVSVVQNNDNLKKQLLLQRGETLVIVPCWWNGTLSSLSATIQFHRPDLLNLLDATDMIPANPPTNFFSAAIAPKNAHLMLASFPSSVELVDISESNAWWLGEKYDGVRCFWNPSEKQLYSRYGFRFSMHPAVNSLFGGVVFDGEMWCGRGQFVESQVLIQASPEKVNWALFRVVCFDEASVQMMRHPFERRYALILHHYPGNHPTVILAPRFLCSSVVALTKILRQIVEEGGEGVILRKPRSLYDPGRSTSLVKLKPATGDQEALVVEVGEDGYLLLQLPDGTNFKAEKEDCVLHRRPVGGDVVTFTHYYASRRAPQGDAMALESPAHPQRPTNERAETPRSAPAPQKCIVYRIREDLSWEDVLRSASHSVRHSFHEDYQKISSHALHDQDFKRKGEAKNPAATVPSNLLSRNVRSRRELFEQFASSRGGNPRDADFWYSVSAKDLSTFKGMDNAIKYNHGYIGSLVHLFPEIHWEKEKFTRNTEFAKRFFENFAAIHCFDPLLADNWANVSIVDLSESREYNDMVQFYGGKLHESLIQVYPNIGLDKQKLKMYKLYVLNRKQQAFKKFARSKGGNPRDPHFWYSLNPKELLQIKSLKFAYPSERYIQTVIRLFPELCLKKEDFKFQTTAKISNAPSLPTSLVTHVSPDLHQGHLESVVRSLFPNVRMTPNARKQANIPNPQTGYYVELDLFLPDLDLCFEFQDNYHYLTSWYSHVPLATTREKDDYKRESVRMRHVTIVSVPFWWDGSENSLSALVHFYRPDLLSPRGDVSLPVSLNPPVQQAQGFVPGVGELMYASFPPSEFGLKSAWWLGEKYDGIRTCWNPIDRVLYSRLGNALFLPSDVARAMPTILLDAEAWFGRGFFVEAQRLKSGNSTWHTTRLIAFDKPDPSARIKFEKRYAILLPAISVCHPTVLLAPRLLCKHKQLLSAFLEAILKDGGEGVILRKQSSMYSHGRSGNLLKLKAIREDGEALVLQTLSPSKFLLQLPNGTVFEAPQKFENAELSPKRGDVVSFSFESFSNRSVPINPEIFRIRQDLTWRDVMLGFLNERPAALFLNEASQQVSGLANKPTSYWSHQKTENTRRFFESFAKARNLDSRQPQTWYSLSAEFVQQKGAKSILAHYNWSYAKALMHVFPDIGLSEASFTTIPHNYWDNIQNRRVLLEEIAATSGFHHLSSEWANLSQETILRFKGCRYMLQRHYNGNVMQALIHLFPEVHLDSSSFSKNTSVAFSLTSFFESFARDFGFDPHIPENWYSVNTEALKDRKGAKDMVQRYGDNYISALGDSFPNVAFVVSKFQTFPRHFWNSVENQRIFFEEYARESGADPLDCAFWYSISATAVLSAKGAGAILSHYGGSVVEALVQLFPDLALDKSRFSIVPKNHWANKPNQRKFFENYALEKGFDPLEPANWYSVNSDIISSHKGAGSILQHYNGGVVDALCNIFPDIGLEKIMFLKKPNKFWSDLRNQREVFENFARSHQFDPLDPSKWYSVSFNTLRSFKNAQSMLAYYNGSIPDALAAVFPEISFEKSKFYLVLKKPKNYWADKDNQRKFFEECAKSQGHTSVIPSKLSYGDIYKYKNASSVLRYYNQSVHEALKVLYPAFFEKETM
eukprot:Phypoly_transcript_00339.p1 GENE.Phypoly_transcript_00339~~Phypoly_transcript_00339.p1  ORF type:complete len:1688 (+),score=210.60 Phypoly_transcript_00339:78-5141(+)